MTWTKTRFPEPAAAQFEADGLRWLGEVADGARVAEVLSVRPGSLELPQISTTNPSAGAARDFGAALARTHAAGAPWFGFVPGDTPGYMGRAALPEPPSGPMAWGEFYARYRVLPFLRTAVERGSITPGGEGVIEQLAQRLIAGDLEHPQPAAVAEVARLHGDLWNGNVLWDADRGGHAVLIDPTAHGGHAETDLAMLDLFGAPHLEDILDGYQQTSALAAGWSERVALHQVNPLLVHAVIFGGGYGQAAVQAAGSYL